MKFVKAKYEIWLPKECNAKNILESIERAAKVCYKSEGNIKEGSALPFVKGLIKRGHTSCLEHGSIYLYVNERKMYEYWHEHWDDVKINPYVNFILKCRETINITNTFSDYRISGRYIANGDESAEMYFYTNARFVYEKCPKLFWDIILERELPNFIQLFTPKEDDPYRRQTVMFTADQRITEEFLRHRVASPNKESTRYCNYSSDKHNNELTYIIPLRLDNIIWDNDIPQQVFYAGQLKWKCRDKFIEDPAARIILDEYSDTEKRYNTLVNIHMWRPEEARIVLNLGVKADLILTNSLIDWCYGRPEPIDEYVPNIEDGEVQGKRIKGFFGLRTDGAAHPQARELAIPLMDDFKNIGWLKHIDQ